MENHIYWIADNMVVPDILNRINTDSGNLWAGVIFLNSKSESYFYKLSKLKRFGNFSLGFFRPSESSWPVTIQKVFCYINCQVSLHGILTEEKSETYNWGWLVVTLFHPSLWTWSLFQLQVGLSFFCNANIAIFHHGRELNLLHGLYLVIHTQLHSVK